MFTCPGICLHFQLFVYIFNYLFTYLAVCLQFQLFVYIFSCLFTILAVFYIFRYLFTSSALCLHFQLFIYIASYLFTISALCLHFKILEFFWQKIFFCHSVRCWWWSTEGRKRRPWCETRPLNCLICLRRCKGQIILLRHKWLDMITWP